MGNAVSNPPAKKQPKDKVPVSVAAPDAPIGVNSEVLDPQTRRVLCRADEAEPQDAIDFWDNAGDPKGTFPAIHKKVRVVLDQEAGALMHSGIGSVAISSSGDALKGGQVTITPVSVGNTQKVINAMLQLSEQLRKAGVVAEQDPDYRCPNFAGMSRGLRIRIAPQK